MNPMKDLRILASGLAFLLALAAHAQVPVTISGRTVNLTITGNPTPYSIEFGASIFTLRANGDFAQSGIYTYSTLSGTEGRAVLNTTAPMEDAGEVDTITLTFSTANSGTFVDNYVCSDSTVGSYSGTFTTTGGAGGIPDASPAILLRANGPQLELTVPAEPNAGALLLFQAPELTTLASTPVITLVTNAPVGTDLRLALAPAQRAFFYAIRKANVPLADFFVPTIPDEPTEPYALWTLGLPTNLVSGTSYTADFLLVVTTNQLANVNGPATLSVVRQTDGSPHPDAIVSPSQITFEQGACRTNVQVTASTSLTGYVIGVTLPDAAPAASAVPQARRVVASTPRLVRVPVILVPTAPPSRFDAFTMALAEVRAYVDAAFWSSPLPVSSPEVAGTFGEWRGHKRAGVPHANVHAGLDLVASAGTTVSAARGGIVRKNDGVALGRYIIVDHLDGTYTRYLHLSPSVTAPAVGSYVNRGAALGEVGSTAETGVAPHLHFEIRTSAPGDSTGQPGIGVDPLQQPAMFAMQTAQTLSTLQSVGVTPFNPATSTYRLPDLPVIGSLATAFIVVQIKQPENGRRLAPRNVRFQAEDMAQAVVLDTPDTAAVQSLLPANSAALPAGFARYLHGDSDNPDPSAYFRYWFRWNVSGYAAGATGPRTFTVDTANYAGTGNAKALKWGPEIRSVTRLGTSGSATRYRVQVRAWVGEDAATAISDMSGGSWATGADWYRYELPAGGLWVANNSATLEETDSATELMKLRTQEFLWTPPAGGSASAFVTVRSRTVTTIAHQMPIEGAGSALNSEFVIRYSWPASQRDLDTQTRFLGGAVGYSVAGSAPFITWTGDDTTSGGSELATIDIAAAAVSGGLPESFLVECFAGWYAPAEGSGPATIEVYLREKTTGAISGRIVRSISPGRQSGAASTTVGKITAQFNSTLGELTWSF